ncbi:MAG: SpoIID/LytB domain-containing protein [Candidatus Obscuribacterales bacterium]|nr:SpoIID/LytB domain-containing protein [Candidatus Obscuribacterales bacterium]
MAFLSRFCLRVITVVGSILFLSRAALALVDQVEVKLFAAHKNVSSVEVIGSFKLLSQKERIPKEGRYVISCREGGMTQLYQLRDGGSKHIVDGRRITLAGRNDRGLIICRPDGLQRRYAGQISFQNRGGLLSIHNLVDSREYVVSVAASEMPHFFHPEARKALCVLTLSRLSNTGSPARLDDTTQFESYLGLEPVNESTREIVNAVFGKRLTYESTSVRAFYHSTCAGSTSDGFEIFGRGAKTLAYLQSVPCKNCIDSPFFKKRSTRMSEVELKKIFDGALPVVAMAGSGNRPLLVNLVSDDGSVKKSISGYQAWLTIGRALGWSRVPGTRYAFKQVLFRGKKQVEIISSGAGHGVGLCQWGAHGLAVSGKTYEEILEFYFPKAKLSERL